ncbi:MAG: DUF192 domain-containing protein [Nitrospirota bacterium]|nr:DUF192 domain-containing protein [Nitrospirota bacterium]
MAMLSFFKLQDGTNKKRIFFLVIMALLLISGALLFNSPGQTQVLTVKFPSGASLKAEVADTPEKLLFGLAFRQMLPPDEAMLYIFGESGPHRVWTKEFQFPVDVIWVDESKIVVHVEKDVPPCSNNPCTWYGPPPNDARYILESNAGFIARENVAVGQQLKFALFIP